MALAFALSLLSLTSAVAQSAGDDQRADQLIDKIVSQIAESAYLSQMDIGYRAIEDLQRAHCDASGACAQRQRACVLAVLSTWAEMFREPAPPDQVKSICQRVSTRYEVPGIYNLLSGLLDKVRRAAESIGLRFPDGIRVGSLAVRSVNASAYPKNHRAVQLILVDIAYFEFANELTKAVARAVPVETVGENYVVSRDLRDLDLKLDADESLLRDFEHGLAQYLGKGEPTERIPPSEFTIPIASAYTAGMETFAVAHEVAHALHGHTSIRTLEPQDVATMPKDSDVVVGANGWAEEIEADVTALRVASRAFQESADDPGANIFSVAAPFAVEYYFTMREIMQAADAKWFLGKPLTTSPTSETDAFARIRPCIDRSGCDLTEFIVREASDLARLQTHPSYALRRQVTRHVFQLERLEKMDADMHRLALFIRESAQRMWRRLDSR